MPPVPPNGDSALTVTDSERKRSEDERSGEIPRRVLAKDGLHLGHARGRDSRPGELRGAEPLPSEERSLMALVSSARHELRAPLQSIQGFAELLATESYGQLGADQRVFIEHIIQGAADLSRSLDACFDLVGAEVLQAPVELLRAPLRPLLEEAIVVTRTGAPLEFDVQLSALTDAAQVEVDLHDFNKAIGAVVTALAPLVRGKLGISVALLEGQVEVTFAAVPGDGRGFGPLHELPRRGQSARAVLWLRLAGSLLARSAARLESNESYDRVRISLPWAGKEPRVQPNR